MCVYVCVDVFEVMCVIHVVVNSNFFFCIQDSEKTPTPPDTQSDESTTSRDTDALKCSGNCRNFICTCKSSSY